MNICQVVASQGKGGLEKHVHDLSLGLIGSGNQVTVLGPEAFLSALPDSVKKKKINGEWSRYNPFLLFDVLKKLRACECDIIHAHANKATSIVARLNALLPCPTVGSLHNMRRNVRPFYGVDYVVTVSQQLATPFLPEKVRVIYNGTCCPEPKKVELKATLNLPREYPVILAVGRLVEAKGFDILLDAIAQLPLSLLIVGSGPAEGYLNSKIQLLNIGHSCRMLGHRSDIYDLMHSADAVVISSIREGFSYVFSEALLCKSLVLSTDVPVANEVLPGELIVPVNDAQALRERLVSLLVDLPRWRNLMAPAWEFAGKELQLSSMIDKTETLYRQVLEARLRA